jgi:hypothetical protein
LVNLNTQEYNNKFLGVNGMNPVERAYIKRFKGVPVVVEAKEDYKPIPAPIRKILSPPKGKDGLFIQPKDVSAEREVIERHNRERFAGHFKFADPLTGATNTYDDKGDYNCGRCNQADGDKCLLVEIDEIDRDAGSCGDWEVTCAADPEMVLHLKSPKGSGYGVAKNGVGFGCSRCPFASRAYQPDSRGRELYCGKGDFRTYGTACCVLNGAPTK